MLNIFGPLNYLGHGIHAYGMAQALGWLGKKIAFFPPFGNVNRGGKDVKEWLENRVDFKKSDPSVMIFDPAFMFHFSGSPRIGFAIFETDVLPPIQVAALRSLDRILVPSQWGRRVIEAHELYAHVVPEGFNPAEFEFFPRSSEEYSKPHFVHVGKFEERKGTEQIIRCFFEALEGKDALLTLHTHNPFIDGGGYFEITTLLSVIGFQSVDWGVSGQRACRFRLGGLEVKISSGFLSTMSLLYKSADVAIFPSKGEAWGLPILEAIASGVPTIAGNWTGQSEFMGDDYPEELALSKSVLAPANDGVWFHGDRGCWHLPTDDELIEKIRWAYENTLFRQTSKWRNKVNEVRERFTWANAAKKFISIIDSV